MPTFRVRELGWAETPAAAPLATAGATTQVTCESAGSCCVQFVEAATLVDGILVFEGRANPTAPWITLHGYPTNSSNKTDGTAETPAITGLPVYGWFVPLSGIYDFRVRLKSRTSGSCRVGIRLAHTAHT